MVPGLLIVSLTAVCLSSVSAGVTGRGRGGWDFHSKGDGGVRTRRPPTDKVSTSGPEEGFTRVWNMLSLLWCRLLTVL